jgi:hypothetical protein
MAILCVRRASAVTAALLLAGLPAARADINDYKFELVATEIRQGDDAVVAVRLIDTRTGEPVPDAVIFATRLDMAPDNMPAMAAPLEALPTSDPGVYRFKADLVMAGGWQLSLAAKVQGEIGTVQDKLVLRAVP